MERNTKLFVLSLVLMACGVFGRVSGYFLSYYERRRTSVITIGIFAACLGLVGSLFFALKNGKGKEK